MSIESTFLRDGNFVPITGKGLIARKTRVFDGTAGKGAQGASTLFTVTGAVVADVFAVCTTNLAGALATVEVGIAGNTAALIAQTTATDIDSGEVWNDATPATVEVLSNSTGKIIGNGQDIIETVATADVTGGSVTYYCLWFPLSEDGNVVAV